MEREKKKAETKGRAQWGRRSGKRKNKRAPPQRKQRAEAAVENAVASLADNSSTDSDILPSTIRKRRVIISTDEEDTNALTDAGMDATGDIIIITDEQDEIDNVEDYLCREGGREEEQEEEDEEEGIYYISEQEDSSDWAN